MARTCAFLRMDTLFSTSHVCHLRLCATGATAREFASPLATHPTAPDRMLPTWRRGWIGLALVLVGLSAISAGCGRSGPRPVPVSGRILLDGQPVRSGYIRVVPQDGRAAGGRIDAEGRFTLGTYTASDGCLPGTHPIEVSSGGSFGDERSREPDINSGGPVVPKRFADFQTSGLHVTIEGATDDLAIQLHSQ